MNKENHFEDLKKIQNMVGSIRMLTESIMFNEEGYGEEDMDMYENPEASELPEDDPQTAVDGDECVDGQCNLSRMHGDDEPDEEAGLRQLGEVDQIREIALRGMIKLCKNPEDDRYQALKKIFQFCDKAAENKDREEK